MAELRFSIAGVEEVRRAMRECPKQARFAAARALTDVVKEAQAQTVRELGRDFTLRSGWVAKGIRVVMANPHDLEAVIGSKDDFMERQEVGGAKRSRGGGSVAVPVGVRRNRTQITRPSRWPKALLSRPGHFLAPISTQGLYMGVERVRRDGSVKVRRSNSAWSDEMGVWRRTGRKIRMTKGRFKGQLRQRIELLYTLETEVDVGPRWHLRRIVERVAKERFVPAFQLRYAEALSTAR